MVRVSAAADRFVSARRGLASWSLEDRCGESFKPPAIKSLLTRTTSDANVESIHLWIFSRFFAAIWESQMATPTNERIATTLRSIRLPCLLTVQPPS